LQKHCWSILSNVTSNANASISSHENDAAALTTLDILSTDPELIRSMVEAGLVSLQVHNLNADVVHVILNTLGTLVWKSSAFRSEFLKNKNAALDTCLQVYKLYASQIIRNVGKNKDNQNTADITVDDLEVVDQEHSIQNFLAVASRWLRLIFYLTRTSKTSTTGMDEEDDETILSPEDWESMIPTVVEMVEKLPLEKIDDDSRMDDADDQKQQDRPEKFLVRLQIQVIQKMASSFFETCLLHRVEKGYLMNAGALRALTCIAENTATVDEATRTHALMVMKALMN